MERFADIWEQEARWITGPGLLGAIIEHLRDKAPRLEPDGLNPNQANLTIPFPEVKDAVSGEYVSITCFIPPELHAIFNELCCLILKDWYDESVDRALNSTLGMASNAHTLARTNSELAQIEHRRIAMDSDDALWVIAASRFGFSRWATPKPARFGDFELHR